MITQNVDDLHRSAGSDPVLELHGSAARARCLSCDWAGASDDTVPPTGGIPPCPRCECPTRPDVVLFGEPLDADLAREAQDEVRHCDTFLAIGTSGKVAPASWLAGLGRRSGARCIDINVHPDPGAADFDVQVVGDAQTVLTEWLAST